MWDNIVDTSTVAFQSESFFRDYPSTDAFELGPRVKILLFAFYASATTDMPDGTADGDASAHQDQ